VNLSVTTYIVVSSTSANMNKRIDELLKKYETDKSPTERLISEKEVTCYFCGSINSSDEVRCSSCNREKIKCLICLFNFQFGDEVGACPYCEKDFHYSHFSEWIKVKSSSVAYLKP